MHYTRESELMKHLAYHVWEWEGRPTGRADDHWREAERLLVIEFRVGYPDPTDTGSAAAKPPADQ